MMTIRDIQVHVDIDSVCSKRVEIAANLAANFNAHLTGVHIRRDFHLPASGVLSESASAGVIDVYNQVSEDNESKARATFDRVIAQGSSTVSWRSVKGSLSDGLAMQARYSDLVVIGQPEPNENMSLNDGIADEIIMSAGRPCLLIPYHGECVNVGESPPNPLGW